MNPNTEHNNETVVYCDWFFTKIPRTHIYEKNDFFDKLCWENWRETNTTKCKSWFKMDPILLWKI